MFDAITEKDVLTVYEQLKNRYDLVLTTTGTLEGYSMDCPIVVGEANGLIVELYAYEGDFILDIKDAERTKGTHGHPLDVDDAIDWIVEFMEGKSDYILHPFRQV